MSRESRDWRKSHGADDDARSRHSSHKNGQDRQDDQDDQGNEPEDERADSQRESRPDHPRRMDRERHAHYQSREGIEHSARREVDSDEADRDDRDDREEARDSEDSDVESRHQRRPDHDGSDRPHGASHTHRPHDYIDDEVDEHAASHAVDPNKFATYDDEEEEEESPRHDATRHSKESAGRSYRAEPAHRPFSDFRAGSSRETTASAMPAQSTLTARSATDPLAFSSLSPAATAGAADPSAYLGPKMHPYDHARASLIGLSTAMVAAIAIIVFLMINLSQHKDLIQSAQKERDKFEDSFTQAKRQAADAQALADQHARDAQLAAYQAEQNQRQAQSNSQAYLAAQTQLRQRQQADVQTQAENQRRLYVTQVRLAKQAWDRGDTNEVLQLLEPYHSDPVRQKLCSFAWYYLWRAAHNGGSSTLRGHSDVVRQALFTPDGSQIFTFADDGQLMVWDAGLGRKLGAVTVERNVPPRSAGLIAEDQLARRAGGLVIGSNGLWAAAYGRTLYAGSNFRQPDSLRPVTDHQAPIISLAMSLDGKRLASGDYSGEIIVRDAIDGRALIHFHNPRPQALALSRDGNLLFAGMHDGGLFVWDTRSGKLLGTRAFGDGINSLALSPDGSALALALGVRDGVVRIWEPGTGSFRGDLRGHHDEVLRVTWSPDGKSLLTASRDQTACLWSSTGSLLRTFRGHLGDVEDAAFSPDGQKVLSSSDDQSAILWNVDGGQPCDMLTDTPVDGWVSGLAFTPDSSQLVGTGSCDGAGDSYEAYLTSWNLADGNRPAPLQTSSRSGVAVAFSPDGRQMAVGESSPPDSKVKSRVRIWSLDPARVLATASKLVGAVYSVAYSNDGLTLAVGTGDVEERVPGSVQILEPSTGALRQNLPLPGKVEASFSADSNYLITINSSKKRPAEVRVWNARTWQLIGQLDNPKELDGLITSALSPDGRYLVTGHGDAVNPAAADKAKIKVWDLTTRQLVAQFPAAHPAAVTRLEFSRRGVILASGDMAGNVRLWDFASRKPLAKQIAQQGRPITYLAFDKLGERLAVAADEKCVRVWHIDSGRQLAILELSLGVPNVVRYNPDGKFLAAATSAGGLFLWDSETFKPRAILRGEGNPAGQQGHGGVITCVEPHLADKLLTGSVDKTVRIWDLKTRKAFATAFTMNQAVSCMAVSPDGHTLAVGTGKYRSRFETGELVLCALDNRQPPRSISQGITPVSMAFSPDGNSLAVCSLSAAVGTAARTVNIVDLRTGHTLAINSPMGHSVAFSPDGHVLAVGCTNGEIDLWPLDSPGTLKPYILKKHQGLVWTIAFSPDGNTMASGSADNNVVIWDVPTAEDLMTLKHNGTIEALKFSADGRLLATAAHEPSRGSVCLWRAPADDDVPQNTLRPVGPALGPTTWNGPAGLDRPASLDSSAAMRPAYPDRQSAPSSAAPSSRAPSSGMASPWSAPAAATAAQPAGFDRAALDRQSIDPVAPMPANYSRAEDDRYGGPLSAGSSALGAPAAIPSAAGPYNAPQYNATQNNAPQYNGQSNSASAPSYNGGSTDPSAPLNVSGSASGGLTPPGGFSQPADVPSNSAGSGRPAGGRRNRPTN
jgi:WD40 repeat protein